MSTTDLENLVKYVTTVAANRTTVRPQYQTPIYFFLLILKTLQLSSSGILEIIGSFAFMWNDTRLAWKPDNYGKLTHVSLPSNSVWTPRIYNLNGASNDFLVGPGDSSLLLNIDYNGSISFFVPKRLASTCVLDLTQFPFDSQTCNISFISVDFAALSVPATNLIPHPSINSKMRSMYSDTGEFSLTDATVHSSVNDTPICIEALCIPSLNITLHYQRRTLYYVWNLVIPGFLLTITVPFVFLLPSENNVKVTMTCSLMVALYILQQNVSRMLPAGLKWSLCGIGTCATLIIGSLSVIAAIATVTARLRQPVIGAQLGQRLRTIAKMCGHKIAPEPEATRAVVVSKEGECLTRIDNGHQEDYKEDMQLKLLAKIAGLLEQQAATQQADASRSRMNVAQAELWKVLDGLINMALFICFIVASLTILIYLQSGLK